MKNKILVLSLLILLLVGCKYTETLVYSGELESVEVKTSSWNAQDLVILRFEDGPVVIQAISAGPFFVGTQYEVYERRYEAADDRPAIIVRRAK